MLDSLVHKNVMLYNFISEEGIFIHEISSLGLMANNHSKFSDCIVDKFSLKDIPGRGWSHKTNIQISMFVSDNKKGKYGFIFASGLRDNRLGFFARIGGKFVNFNDMCGGNAGNEIKVFESHFPYHENIFIQKDRSDLFEEMNPLYRANIALLRLNEVSNSYFNFLFFLAKHDSIDVSDLRTSFAFASMDFGRIDDINENEPFLIFERLAKKEIFLTKLDIKLIQSCEYSVNSKNNKYYKINTSYDDMSKNGISELKISPYDQNNGYEFYHISHVVQGSIINVYAVNLNETEKNISDNQVDKSYDNLKIKKLMIGKYDKIGDKFILSDSLHVGFVSIANTEFVNVEIASNYIDKYKTSIILNVVNYNEQSDFYQSIIFTTCLKDGKLFFSKVFCDEVTYMIDYGVFHRIYDNLNYESCDKLVEIKHADLINEIRKCSGIVHHSYETETYKKNIISDDLHNCVTKSVNFSNNTAISPSSVTESNNLGNNSTTILPLSVTKSKSLNTELINFGNGTPKQLFLPNNSVFSITRSGINSNSSGVNSNIALGGIVLSAFAGIFFIIIIAIGLFYSYKKVYNTIHKKGKGDIELRDLIDSGKKDRGSSSNSTLVDVEEPLNIGNEDKSLA